MQKFTVSQDDSIYEAFPDIIMLESGRLVCVFTECEHHGNQDNSRLVCKISEDRGRTWSDKYPVTERGRRDAFSIAPDFPFCPTAGSRWSATMSRTARREDGMQTFCGFQTTA